MNSAADLETRVAEAFRMSAKRLAAPEAKDAIARLAGHFVTPRHAVNRYLAKRAPFVTYGHSGVLLTHVVCLVFASLALDDVQLRLEPLRAIAVYVTAWPCVAPRTRLGVR